MDAAELARGLPDVPRWLELRSMLLSGSGEVIGADPEAFVVADAEDGLVCVFGRPWADDIREAVSRLSGARAVICL